MIKDFLTTAYPWIVTGLTIAILAATVARNKSMRKGCSTSYFSVALLWYSLCIFKSLTLGNFSSGIISMCIGSMFLCLGAACTNYQEKEKEKDKR